MCVVLCTLAGIIHAVAMWCIPWGSSSDIGQFVVATLPIPDRLRQVVLCGSAHLYSPASSPHKWLPWRRSCARKKLVDCHFGWFCLMCTIWASGELSIDLSLSCVSVCLKVRRLQLDDATGWKLVGLSQWPQTPFLTVVVKTSNILRYYW